MTQTTIERNESFDLAYRFATETGESIFLTGKAGTGKTTFLKFLTKNCFKNLIVAAPTGVAAINAAGVTLHSLFQLPFDPFIPTRSGKEALLGKLKFNKQRLDLLRKMDMLVIDEISMVRADVMDAIDTILRSVRHNHETPFGGVQLLCIGDLFQLPPVVKNHEWTILNEYYASPFFFDSLAIKEQMPLLIELDKIYRQKESGFVKLLNKVRNNEMTADDFEDLHLRYHPGFQPDEDDKYITLSSHNNQADTINNRKLGEIISPAYIFKAEVEDDFAPHLYPVEEKLELKVGAQVMFLKNDINKRFFNGKIGTVAKLDHEKVIVECDGSEIEVGKETWENTRYTLDKKDGKLSQEVLGTFTQYPLRLAWAITIHKSQGLTFDKVMIDAGSAFSSGQVYVALSRCTSLEGIVLLSKIPVSAIFSNDQVVEGHQKLSHKGSLEDRFQGARLIFTQQILEEIFSFYEAERIAKKLTKSIASEIHKLNPEDLLPVAQTWINGVEMKILELKKYGLRFLQQVTQFIHENPALEENNTLQDRLVAASGYFYREISAMLSNIENNPLLSEHTDTATMINAQLVELALHLHGLQYTMEYTKNGFRLTQYLQHKIDYKVPKLKINIYATAKGKSHSGAGHSNDLLSTLKNWRDMTCESQHLAVYMLANQKTLQEIANFRPLSKKDLLKITGFGKVKADRYGDEIIEMVEDYCMAMDLESNMDEHPANKKTSEKKGSETDSQKKSKSGSKKGDSQLISYNLFKSGLTIEEIAEKRNMVTGTILGHLEQYVESGELDGTQFVQEKHVDMIQSAIAIYGMATATLLKQNLPDTVSFGEIRMMMAMNKRTEKA